jgi:hypothetical protein
MDFLRVAKIVCMAMFIMVNGGCMARKNYDLQSPCAGSKKSPCVAKPINFWIEDFYGREQYKKIYNNQNIYIS